MTSIELKKLLLGSTLIAGFTAFTTAPSFAQDAEDAEEAVVEIIEADEDEADEDEVVVTGSRIKRDTFSSIQPIQIIDFEEERDLGLVDTVSILQNSEAAAGVQIDSSFSGFVLDNGPGSETIDLRGLGPERTLVLINGRRMAPAGVEGAPSQPSINLLPSSLVQQVDQLLDGASSVYGSDAIAGVINVILDTDFDGLEINGFYSGSEQQNGNGYNVSAKWGKNWDRAFVGFGAEYNQRDSLQIRDRDFLNDCNTHYEIDENGNIRTVDIEDQTSFDFLYSDGIQAADNGNPCKLTAFSGRIFVDPLSGFGNGPGSIYYVEGQSNTGIPNFVDQSYLGTPIDADNDGVQDFGFQQFNINGSEDFNRSDIVAEQDRISLMAFGEFTIEGEANVTPYFEALYSEINTSSDGAPPQIFPTVGADNPTNPCGNGGIDCRASLLDLNFNAAFVERFRDDNEALCARFGFSRASCTPFLFGAGRGFGPAEVIPVVAINGDRDNYEVSLAQTRLVAGFKGDLPFANKIAEGFDDWTFDVSLTHSFSDGQSDRSGIRDDRLNLALGNLVNTIRDDQGNVLVPEGTPIPGAVPCEVSPFEPVGLSASVTAGCVPVNLLAANVIGQPVGELTQAERDYLFDNRSFNTKVFQTVAQAFATGKIAKVPAGDVQAVVGFEWREDKIDSVANDVARDGLLFGFFTDAGTTGSKWVREAFAEVDIPVIADTPFFERLDVNLSARVLEDEFYGNNSVYAAKAGWRPFDSLLIKGSWGTSFRSPNLRELFLGAQSGFTSVSDPCYVPTDAFIVNPSTGEGVYLPDEDTRDQSVLDACIREGLDPTTLGEGGSSVTGVEVFRIGTTDLDPETSRSVTFGASFEQPFTDAFDLSLGGTYYNIKVEDEVVGLGAQFTVNDCFILESDSRSTFCDNIRRDEDGDIEFVDLAFDNQDESKVRGIDFNARAGKDFNAFNLPWEFDTSVRANHIIEVSERFVADNGEILSDNDEGEFGFSDWQVTGRASLRHNDISLNYGFTWISAVEQDEDFVDDFGNILADTAPAFAFSSTCGGPTLGDVNCRDVGFADDYWLHNVGVSYANEDNGWSGSIAVRNLFDETPPLVDSSEVTSVSNAPIGAGYDFYGRTIVMSVGKRF